MNSIESSYQTIKYTIFTGKIIIILENQLWKKGITAKKSSSVYLGSDLHSSEVLAD